MKTALSYTINFLSRKSKRQPTFGGQRLLIYRVFDGTKLPAMSAHGASTSGVLLFACGQLGFETALRFVRGARCLRWRLLRTGRHA